MNKVILASASPRRKELLTQIGMEFVVVKSTCEEKQESTDPALVVCELSAQKAEDVYRMVKAGETKVDKGEDFVVIGADTIVAHQGKILGKPADEEDAVRMLRTLSGDSHQVYTGVTFCFTRAGQMQTHTFYEKTTVTFYPMSEEEIRAYVDTKDPLDKAGAYGIQGRCAAYIKGIEGDYNNVVGLPVGRLYQEWKEQFGQ